MIHLPIKCLYNNNFVHLNCKMFKVYFFLLSLLFFLIISFNFSFLRNTQNLPRGEAFVIRVIHILKKIMLVTIMYYFILIYILVEFIIFLSHCQKRDILFPIFVIFFNNFFFNNFFFFLQFIIGISKTFFLIRSFIFIFLWHYFLSRVIILKAYSFFCKSFFTARLIFFLYLFVCLKMFILVPFDAFY
jgi:hypothetical protein